MRAVELAEDAIGVGDLDGAILILERHLAAHPDDAEARELLAAARAAKLPPGPTYGDLRADTRHLKAPAEPVGAAPPVRPAPPLGVAIIAGLDLVFGVGVAFLGVALMLAGAVAGLLLVILGIGAMAIGVALWRLRTWAWLLEIGLNGIGVVANLVSLGRGDALALLGLAVNLAVIAYLVRVGRLFGARAGEQPRARVPNL